MATVEELIIKATPDGMDDVQDGLESMEQQAEETTDEMEDQSRSLGEVSEKFQGAMGAIVAGFAVVTAGLLSRVPVLGEAASGLSAILDALALKIDKRLRPVLVPLTNLFFKIANAINEADGPLGKLIGAFSTAVTLSIAFTTAVLGASKALAALGLSFGSIVAAAKAVGAGIAALAASIGAVPLAIAGALVALGAFVVAYLTNWNNLRDKTNTVLGNIYDAIKTRFNEAKEKVTSILGGIGSEAVEWGKDIISKLIKGIKKKAAELKSTITGINLTDNITIGDISSSIGGAIETSAEAISGTSAGATGGTGGNATYLDGQRIDDNQGQYRKDSLTLRGL